MTHICVGNLTIIGSDIGLSPGRRQAIIWTNANILLIWPLGTNFSEIFIETLPFSFKKMHLKMSSGKWRPPCLGLNVLTPTLRVIQDDRDDRCLKWHQQLAVLVVNCGISITIVVEIPHFTIEAVNYYIDSLHLFCYSFHRQTPVIKISKSKLEFRCTSNRCSVNTMGGSGSGNDLARIRCRAIGYTDDELWQLMTVYCVIKVNELTTRWDTRCMNIKHILKKDISTVRMSHV